MYFKPCSNLIGFAFGFEFRNKMEKNSSSLFWPVAVGSPAPACSFPSVRPFLLFPPGRPSSRAVHSEAAQLAWPASKPEAAARSAAWHHPHAPSLPRWLPWPTRQMFLLARNRHGLAMAVSFFDTSHLGTLRPKLTRPFNSSLSVPCVPHRALDWTIAPPGARVSQPRIRRRSLTSLSCLVGSLSR